MRCLFVIATLVLGACGASQAPVPADEVTEAWTAGDDEPLEE